MAGARTPCSSRPPMRSTRVSAATAEPPTSRRHAPPERSSSSSTVPSRSISTRPRTSSSPRAASGRSMSPDGAQGASAGAPGATARVEVAALEGIPEIEPGDDLPSLIGDALERTTGLLPLRPDDVIVVTQKVVSKAEGAIVDLTAVEPRAEAQEFAKRWDRDPRQ